MKKTRVLVLMGGKSPEHEISLISGMQVLNKLDRSKFEAIPVIITKDGTKLQLVSSNELKSLPDPLTLKGTKRELIKKAEKEIESVNRITGKNDVVFIAMHGPFGEDGTVQGMVELTGLPYTGSGVLASALGMDKNAFRKVLKSAGIKIPRYLSVKKGEKIKDIGKKLGRPPYFVKPSNQGSSVGNSIVKKLKDLSNALKEAYKYSEIALIDEYLKGREVTCAVLGNEKPFALPLIEIIPLKGEYFDYDSKYRESGSEEIIPARISKKLTKEIQNIALKVFKEIGCRGFARVDFIIKDNKIPYVLEINTIPGLTPMSLLPKAAKAYGYSYTKLLSEIINYAIEKK